MAQIFLGIIKGLQPVALAIAETRPFTVPKLRQPRKNHIAGQFLPQSEVKS
ncbi:hypothetical protein [Pararhizobium sp.]|uniref:hypothetical protein n=1 Tax=Pararhizobium sp. TaxID=1977563 RepID=UPI002724303A|nr:hypothetical protein [Pararhizobium sp.]MDO9415749.1 hypothetical protein [Pararhizobium sp.]